MTAFFLVAAAESFVVLAVAGAACFCLGRAAAATRHFIWLAAVLGVTALPLAEWFLPTWDKPLGAVSASSRAADALTLEFHLTPAAPAMPSADETTPNGQPTAPNQERPLTARINVNWLRVGFAAWLTGTLLVFGRTLAGRWRVHRLERSASRLAGEGWEDLLAEVRGCWKINRPVLLLQGEENIVPATWGTWRPKVLIPAESAQWTAERRRVVLQHELAHVRRWDCATQFVTNLACAIYWFNPLVWLADRQMAMERERACDDLVLSMGGKASDYAGHLVDLAHRLRPLAPVAAIAMARAGALTGRVTAIVDTSRARAMRPVTGLIVGGLATAVILGTGAFTSRAAAGEAAATALRQEQIDQLKKFSALKLAQAMKLASDAGEKWLPVYQRFYDAALKGDGQTVINLDYEYFQKHHPQYSTSANHSDLDLRTSYWQTVLEICLAYDIVCHGAPAYTQMAIDDTIKAIPAGSIYFGGTDPGRGLPTAFCRSQPEADPFFVLTQNALADSSYLQYLQAMYGGKIYIPSQDDAQNCFKDYVADATQRLHQHRLKPNEMVREDHGHVEISGAGAVMNINARLAKIIFAKNPGREFYVEESFPLDWMYPYLEPIGPIMKINRHPPAALPQDAVQRDREYWRGRVAGMLGDWLKEDSSAPAAADFVERVYVHGHLSGFTGDRQFIRNDYAKRMFSKLRSSIAGIYVWRAANSTSLDERAPMKREADLALRQAWVLCPYSPDVAAPYVDFLLAEGRKNDARVIAQTARRAWPSHGRESDKTALAGLQSKLNQ